MVLATLSLPLCHVTTLRFHVAGIPKAVHFSLLFSDNPNISESEQTTPPINSEYRGSTVFEINHFLRNHILLNICVLSTIKKSFKCNICNISRKSRFTGHSCTHNNKKSLKYVPYIREYSTHIFSGIYGRKTGGARII